MASLTNAEMEFNSTDGNSLADHQLTMTMMGRLLVIFSRCWLSLLFRQWSTCENCHSRRARVDCIHGKRVTFSDRPRPTSFPRIYNQHHHKRRIQNAKAAAEEEDDDRSTDDQSAVTIHHRSFVWRQQLLMPVAAFVVRICWSSLSSIDDGTVRYLIIAIASIGIDTTKGGTRVTVVKQSQKS